jgi:hypothetical protein
MDNRIAELVVTTKYKDPLCVVFSNLLLFSLRVRMIQSWPMFHRPKHSILFRFSRPHFFYQPVGENWFDAGNNHAKRKRRTNNETKDEFIATVLCLIYIDENYYM